MFPDPVDDFGRRIFSEPSTYKSDSCFPQNPINGIEVNLEEFGEKESPPEDGQIGAFIGNSDQGTIAFDDSDLVLETTISGFLPVERNRFFRECCDRETLANILPGKKKYEASKRTDFEDLSIFSAVEFFNVPQKERLNRFPEKIELFYQIVHLYP